MIFSRVGQYWANTGPIDTYWPGPIPWANTLSLKRERGMYWPSGRLALLQLVQLAHLVTRLNLSVVIADMEHTYTLQGISYNKKPARQFLPRRQSLKANLFTFPQ